MNNPKISVVTVVYNSAALIENTVNSIINQSYSHIEYIVVDGGSTDGTIDILNRYKKNISTLISEPDRGIYDAMNKGISLATGDFVVFINSGDKFSSDDILENIFSNPEAASADSEGAHLIDFVVERNKDLIFAIDVKTKSHDEKICRDRL